MTGPMSYDWQQIGNVAASVNTSLGKFNEAINAIFNEVAAMGESWSGASYDAFKTYCDNYKSQTIDPLANEIGTWVQKLDNLSQRAQETSQGNTSLFGG